MRTISASVNQSTISTFTKTSVASAAADTPMIDHTKPVAWPSASTTRLATAQAAQHLAKPE